MSNPYQPYEQQQPAPPYGQQPPVYGQPPAYGQQPVPQQPPAYGQQPAPDPTLAGYPAPPAQDPNLAGFSAPPAGDAPPPPPPGGYPAGYGRASIPTPVQYAETYDPAPRRKRWPIVVSILGVVVLLLGFLAFVYLKPILDEYPATLATPDTLVGHERSQDERLRATATEALASLRSEIQLDDAIAEFYQDPQDPTKIVWLLGGTKFILDPASELDDAFQGASTSDLAIDNTQDIDPGPLGGVARCGAANVSEADGLSIAVCAWADHGSLVIVMFLNRTVTESADLLRQIRTTILTR